MSKKEVRIGDKFGTWEVIGHEENNRKYNYYYIAKCDCGNKKVFRKDTLTDGKFSKCKKCDSVSLLHQKKDLISKKWNTLINGAMPSLNKLEVNKKYSWRCEDGHTYESSILMLNEKCPKCVELWEKGTRLQIIQESFEMLVEFLDGVASHGFGNEIFKIEADYGYKIMRITYDDFVLVCVPKYHKQYNQIIHRDKREFLEIQKYINDLSTADPKRTTIHIELYLDYEIDRGVMTKSLVYLRDLMKNAN